MPKCITHYLHAKKVLNNLQASTSKNMNSNAYFWGAQGPDLFFTHRYLPFMRGESISEYGGRLHSEVKPSVVFNALRAYLEKNAENVIVKSYILGFVNHYALDSRTHPYINMLSQKLLDMRENETLTTMHAEIESALDTIILRKECGKLPTEVKLSKFFPKDKQIQLEISKMYVNVLLEIFKEDVSFNAIYQATEDARMVYSLLTDRTTLKKRIFDLIESGKTHKISSYILPIMEDSEIDYANFKHEEWTAGAELSEKDFFELFDEAVNNAEKMIADFIECDFVEITREVPFG